MKELPSLPPVGVSRDQFTFKELYEFEEHEKDLQLDIPARGNGFKIHGNSNFTREKESSFSSKPEKAPDFNSLTPLFECQLKNGDYQYV